MVDDFVHQCVSSLAEVESRRRRSGLKRPYSDPLLHSASELGKFVSHLAERNIVDYVVDESSLGAPSRGEPVLRRVERVGLFFVKKKQGRLRMVADCRLSNLHFEQPDGVQLATGEALANIECAPEDELWVDGADLKDAFYHFELPDSLRDIFSLRSVSAASLGLLPGFQSGRVPWCGLA